MIEEQTIGGRHAIVAYLTDGFEPATKEDAKMIKVMFDNGEVVFLVPAK